MMKFTPRKENELNRLLQPGEYCFEITDAKDKTSDAGNEMIELKLNIFDGEDVAARIYDYLMEKVAYKLRHCCDACGLIDQYNSGMLDAAMFIGRAGRAKIIIQQDKTGRYPDKNSIRDYVKAASGNQNRQDPNTAFNTAAINDHNAAGGEGLPF